MIPAPALPSETSQLIKLVGIWLIAIALLIISSRVRKSRSRGKNQVIILSLIPFLELFVICLALFLTGRTIFENEPAYLTYLVILIVAIVVWSMRFAFNDIIAGIVLRSEILFNEGETFVFENHTGEIKNVGYRCLTITRTDGQDIRIPYLALSRSSIQEPTRSEMIKSHSFRTTAPKDIPITGVVNRIRITGLCAPWSSPTRPPTVEVVASGDQTRTYQITIFSPETRYFPEIEKNHGGPATIRLLETSEQPPVGINRVPSSNSFLALKLLNSNC